MPARAIRTIRQHLSEDPFHPLIQITRTRLPFSQTANHTRTYDIGFTLGYSKTPLNAEFLIVSPTTDTQPQDLAPAIQTIAQTLLAANQPVYTGLTPERFRLTASMPTPPDSEEQFNLYDDIILRQVRNSSKTSPLFDLILRTTQKQHPIVYQALKKHEIMAPNTPKEHTALIRSLTFNNTIEWYPEPDNLFPVH